MMPSAVIDTRPCYKGLVQVDGIWVSSNSVRARVAGKLLPPRDRLSSRRMTLPTGESRTVPRPYVETVWESYVTYPYDYASCPNAVSNIVDEDAFANRLADVPVSSVDGMVNGADIIDIAYAYADEHRCTNVGTDCQPFVCGLNLFKNVPGDAARYEALIDDIQALKRKGAVVNLAFGGDQWGNLMFQSATTNTADSVVDDIIKTALELNVDGINLVQESGVGIVTMGDDSETSVQLYMIDALRARMPLQMMLSYTFPGNDVVFPFRDIVKYGHPYLDFINVHMANTDSMIVLMEIGVPQPKLSWGIPIGCNEADIGEWGLEDTISIAKISRDHGFGGVFEWSVNRDTNRRSEGLGCCPLQTGMPDGTYLTNIAAVCNSGRLAVEKTFYQGGTYAGHSTCRA